MSTFTEKIGERAAVCALLDEYSASGSVHHLEDDSIQSTDSTGRLAVNRSAPSNVGVTSHRLLVDDIGQKTFAVKSLASTSQSARYGCSHAA